MENPVTARIGRFGFTLLAAFAMPLVLIMMFANEKVQSRYELLVSMND